MADVAITRREVISRGAFKTEIGDFVNATGATFEVRTKLGRLVAFRLQSVNVTDNDVAKYLNFSDAGETVAPGVVHLLDQLSAGTYMYEAIGVG